MTKENQGDRGKMGRLIQSRDSELDRLLEENKAAIDHTREFLNRLIASREDARQYVETIYADLEERREYLRKLRELSRKNDNES